MSTSVEQAVQALRLQQEQAVAKETARQVVRLQDTADRLAEILTEINDAVTAALASPPSEQGMRAVQTLANRYAQLLSPAQNTAAARLVSGNLVGGSVHADRILPSSLNSFTAG